ncbi:MAG: acyl-ACP--UDP-N-acetylglucosamine O-acyltransferase [Armatimonadetes bacterium]|nr:acyl-ACP--UDP-N-acetylglucosamine O-acyltransferase [Armatimonadota bacterium]
MVAIHPTALVDDTAELGADVEVGPFCIIEAGARLGDGCKLASQVVIRSRTSIGARCTIDTGAVLGGRAQDLKCSTDETFLEIGEDNTIREYVTIHRSNHEGGTTRVGDGNLFMAFVHLGHDVVVGSRTYFANAATLGGHVQVDDRAVIGGMTAVHQRVRIGELAMVGGMTGVNTDVPPYSMVEGHPGKVRGINTIGLRRNGVSAEARLAIKTAIREIFCAGRHRGTALEEMEGRLPKLPEVETLLAFARAIRAGHNGRQLEQ